MVEAKPSRNLLIKLQLTEQVGMGKKPVCKRVKESDYASLMTVATKLAAKRNMEPEGLRYDDGHDWVMIEDDEDLELAYDFATTKCTEQTASIIPAQKPGKASQIIFNIKMKEDAEQSYVEHGYKGHEDEEQQSALDKKSIAKGANKVKGVPRKTLKNLISKEYDK